MRQENLYNFFFKNRKFLFNFILGNVQLAPKVFFPKLPQHEVCAEIGELKQIKRVFTNSNHRIL